MYVFDQLPRNCRFKEPLGYNLRAIIHVTGVLFIQYIKGNCMRLVGSFHQLVMYLTQYICNLLILVPIFVANSTHVFTLRYGYGWMKVSHDSPNPIGIQCEWAFGGGG